MTVGVLFINTGTADEPTVDAVAAYLREFLMDPAIIGAPKFIRTLIVNHVVRNRPRRTVSNYQQFWTPEGSPFVITSKEQVRLLEEALSGRFEGELRVVLAMRYGNPSIRDGLRDLYLNGCDELVLFPAYPQMVNVCAGTCFKRAREVLSEMERECGWRPRVVEVPHFYQSASYRRALAEQVAAHWTYTDGSKLLVSYHSTLMADIEAGDPYRDQAEETACNLAYDLAIPLEDVKVCYQSRFDSRKWLQPFTESTVLALADQGVKDLAILCPIFVADNLETSLEIDRDLRKVFLEAAGEGSTFTYIPALNDAPGLIEACVDAISGAMKRGELELGGRCGGVGDDGCDDDEGEGDFSTGGSANALAGGAGRTGAGGAGRTGAGRTGACDGVSADSTIPMGLHHLK